jgi:predicted ATPase
MVAQTLNNTAGERPLILNGELVRLGHALEVLHEGDEQRPLKISFTLIQSKTTSQPNGEERRNTETIHVVAEFRLPNEGNLGFDLSRAELSSGDGVGIIAQKLTNERTITDLDMHQDWQVDPNLRAQVKKGIYDYIVQRQTGSSSLTEIHSPAVERFSPHISFFHLLPKDSLELYDHETEFQVKAMRSAADCIIGEKQPELIEGLKGINLRDRQGRRLQEALRIVIIHTIDSYRNQRSIKVYSQSDITSSNTDQALRSLITDLSATENFGDWVQLVLQKLLAPTRKKLAQRLNLDAADLEVKTRQKSSNEDRSTGLRVGNLPPEIVGVVREVIDFFTERLRYLGPIRDDPRAIYGIPFNPETKDVGVKGEFTAAVLERYKEEVVTNPLPPSEGVFSGKTKTTRLINAISEWLQYMDLVENVTTLDHGKIGYELLVRSAGVVKDLDLTNVGVGVSQVLPTLVMALLAPKDSILLFEQPELHLHPKVQSRLGDFLFGIALSGRQCIIETHSEYLINRVRRRIVEAEGKSLLEKTSIYFVERIRGESQFKRVQPNEYGAILAWPKGFFDEGPAEAELIMEAAMKKRNQENEIKKKVNKI